MLVLPSFDSNIRLLYFRDFRAKGARGRVNFSAINFLYFVARIAGTPSLFSVNIMKDEPFQRKNTQLRESISIYTSIYTDLSVKELTKNNVRIRMLDGKMVI